MEIAAVMDVADIPVAIINRIPDTYDKGMGRESIKWDEITMETDGDAATGS